MIFRGRLVHSHSCLSVTKLINHTNNISSVSRRSTPSAKSLSAAIDETPLRSLSEVKIHKRTGEAPKRRLRNAPIWSQKGLTFSKIMSAAYVHQVDCTLVLLLLYFVFRPLFSWWLGWGRAHFSTLMFPVNSIQNAIVYRPSNWRCVWYSFCCDCVYCSM